MTSSERATRRWISSRTPSSGMFLQMDHAKSRSKAAGVDIIDLSIGTPDMLPPQEALDVLQASLSDPTTYKYCLKSGTMPLLEAAVAWYQRRYGVQLDAQSEALSLVGSQEGLAHLLLAVADPGDGIIMTDVAYPAYFGAAQVAGLRTEFVPLGPDLLPALDHVPAEAAAQCKVLLLNFPNNPTSAVATEQFFQQALDFCRQHDLLLVHDNPYVDLVFGGCSPSPLALPGARERVVELFSFAKSYHMGGFRLGFALGCAEALAALEAVKAPVDFNQYVGIQRMGIACLSLPEERVRAHAEEFEMRAGAMADALAAAGWAVPRPAAGMYIWAALPGGLDDLQFCMSLVAERGIALSPGRGFGPGGHGHVRIALVQPVEVLCECAGHIGAHMRQLLGEAKQ